MPYAVSSSRVGTAREVKITQRESSNGSSVYSQSWRYRKYLFSTYKSVSSFVCGDSQGVAKQNWTFWSTLEAVKKTAHGSTTVMIGFDRWSLCFQVRKLRIQIIYFP